MKRPNLFIQISAGGLFAFALSLFAVLVVFYAPVLFGLQNYYYRDYTLFYEPFCRYLAERMSHGELPLWNPYIYCGASQAALLTPGIFYPPDWLFILLPFGSALAANLVLTQLAAGIGGFLLVEDLGWGKPASWLAGLLMALNGYMFSLSDNNFTLAAGSAWFVFLLAILVRLSRAAQLSAGKLWLGSIATLFLVTTGRPEIVAASLLLCAAWLLVIVLVDQMKLAESHSAQARLLYLVKRLWQPALAVLAGILLSTPSLFPAAEWVALSRRSAGLGASEALVYSANWYDLACILLLQPLGDLMVVGVRFLGVASDEGITPFVSSSYLGPAAVLVALVGLLDKAWKGRFLVLLGAVIFLLISAGSHGPFIKELMAAIPQLSVIRFPVKYLFFADFFLVIMAARGIFVLTDLSEAQAKLRSVLWLPVLLVISLLLVGLLCVASPTNVAQLLPPAGAKVMYGTASLNMVAVGRIASSCFVAASIALVTLAGVVTCRKRPRIGVAGICLIASATLLSAAWMHDRHYAGPGYFKQDSLVQKLIAKLRKAEQSPLQAYGPRHVLAYLDDLATPVWLLTHDAHFATGQWYQYERQLMAPNANIDFHEPSAFGYECTAVGEYWNTFKAAYLLSHLNMEPLKIKDASVYDTVVQVPSDEVLYRLCQDAAVDFVVVPMIGSAPSDSSIHPVSKLDDRWFNLDVEDRQPAVRIYHVRNPKGRVRMVNALSVSPTEMREGLIQSPSKLVLVQDRPEHIVIDYDNSQDGWLVLADQFYPGWTAQLDDQRVDIVRANHFFRAVHAPKGKHLVRFDYEPASLTKGFVCAAIALVLLVVAAIASATTRPRTTVS